MTHKFRKYTRIRQYNNCDYVKCIECGLIAFSNSVENGGDGELYASSYNKRWHLLPVQEVKCEDVIIRSIIE